MNIVINPDYSKLSLFIKQLPSDFSNGGDMIYEMRPVIKLRNSGYKISML